MKRSRRDGARSPAGRIRATEAAKSFGRLVDRVREEGISYVIERSGTPVARIGPVEDLSCTLGALKALLIGAPRLDEDYLRAVEGAASRHNRPRVRRNPWAR